MIPIDDQGVFVQGWGAALAVAMLDLHVSKIRLPDQLSRVAEAEQAHGAERDIQPGAVHARRIGRQAAGIVSASVGQSLVEDGLPQDLT